MKFGESGGAAAETCRRRRPPPQVSAAAAAAPHRVISLLVMKIQDKSYHVALPKVRGAHALKPRATRYTPIYSRCVPELGDPKKTKSTN